MNIESFRHFCLSLPFVEECFPFDETTLVFKVMGKMFALTDTEGIFQINLKCDPEKAIELREHYPAVTPGYHMNKKLWNTVTVDGSINDNLLHTSIQDSYDLVVAGISTKIRK